MSRRLLALAVVALAGCVAVTVIEGWPRDLPAVALGSPVTWAPSG